MALRRREQAVLYQRWLLRQEAIRARDKKVRRFLFGLGAVVGLGLLTACTVGGWLVYHTLTHISTNPAGWLVGVALAVIAVSGVLLGGHRCITTIQHWH
jgi:hypothetical protein